MCHIIDSEATEVDFLDLSEEPQEYEEIIGVVCVSDGFSEHTKFVGTQGKPWSIYTFNFWKSYSYIKITGYFMIVH